MRRTPKLSAAQLAANREERRKASEAYDRSKALRAPIEALYDGLSGERVDIQAGRDFIHTFYDSWRRTAYHLPPWQREFVWTDQQKLDLYNRVFVEGGYLGSMVVWRRRVRTSDEEYNTQYLILDGQQRLTSLGVPLRRYDGTIQETKLPTWNCMEMKWGWDPVDPERGFFTMPQIIEPYPLLKKIDLEGKMDIDDPVLGHLHCATDRSHRIDLVMIRLDTTGVKNRSQSDVAIGAFRDLNRGGTPISQEALNSLMEAAERHGDDW